MILAESEGPPIDVGQLLGRFRDDAALVAKLFIENDAFRHACEDLLLARATLIQLEERQEQRKPAEIAEYRQLAAELESEIAAAIQYAKQAL